jgi:plasmid stabilization system protein ParE
VSYRVRACAERDIDDAAAWYRDNANDPGVVVRFLIEGRAAFETIAEAPLSSRVRPTSPRGCEREAGAIASCTWTAGGHPRAVLGHPRVPATPRLSTPRPPRPASCDAATHAVAGARSARESVPRRPRGANGTCPPPPRVCSTRRSPSLRPATTSAPPSRATTHWATKASWSWSKCSSTRCGQAAAAAGVGWMPASAGNVAGRHRGRAPGRAPAWCVFVRRP